MAEFRILCYTWNWGFKLSRGGKFCIIATMPLKKKSFFHLQIPFFPQVLHVYSHSKLFSEKFLTFPLYSLLLYIMVINFSSENTSVIVTLPKIKYFLKDVF